MTYETNFLQHHGIKGQSWGVQNGPPYPLSKDKHDKVIARSKAAVRRTAAPDDSAKKGGNGGFGSLKSAGVRKSEASSDETYRSQLKREKESGKKISKHREALIKTYQEKGLTQDDAEIQALKREKVEKFLKAGCAVALTAALAYGAYKGHQYIQRYGDQVIPKGSSIYRVMSESSENDDWTGYAVTDSTDAIKYRGALGAQLLNQQLFGARPDNGVWRMEAKSKSDIKIAGEKVGAQVFERLRNEDADFANDVRDTLKEWASFNNGRGDYDAFNTALCDHQTPAALRAQKKFYDALKAKGYGGVIDVNDRRYSGYNTKNPYIIFNLGKQISDKKIARMDNYDIAQDLRKAKNLILAEQQRALTSENFVRFAKKSAMYSTAFAALSAASLAANEVANSDIGKQNKALIKQYRNEHPNTKMSDQEILDSLDGKK